MSNVPRVRRSAEYLHSEPGKWGHIVGQIKRIEATSGLEGEALSGGLSQKNILRAVSSFITGGLSCFIIAGSEGLRELSSKVGDPADVEIFESKRRRGSQLDQPNLSQMVCLVTDILNEFTI